MFHPKVITIPHNHPHIQIVRQKKSKPPIERDTLNNVLDRMLPPVTSVVTDYPVADFLFKPKIPKRRPPIERASDASVFANALIQQPTTAELPPRSFTDLFSIGGGIPIAQYLNTQEAPAVSAIGPDFAKPLRELPENTIKTPSRYKVSPGFYYDYYDEVVGHDEMYASDSFFAWFTYPKIVTYLTTYIKATSHDKKIIKQIVSDYKLKHPTKRLDQDQSRQFIIDFYNMISPQ